MPHISWPAKVAQESLREQSNLVSDISQVRKQMKMNKGKPKQRLGVVKMLFAKLQANYGGLFTSSFSTKAMLDYAIDEWRVELAPYSKQIIMQACDICKQQYIKGPTMTEFSNVCKAIKRSKEIPEQKTPWQQTEYGKEMAKKLREQMHGNN